LRRAAQIVLGIAVALATVCVGYMRRLELGASFWHVFHGQSVLCGGYRIPVPDGWTVMDQGEEDVTLVAARTDGAIISVLAPRARLTAPRDMDLWIASKHRLLDEQGLTQIVDHSVQYDGQRVACLTGSRPRNVTLRASSTFVNMDCASTGPLNFLFLGQQSELQDFDKIVSQIQKSN
jgi:hypothetical protein